MKFRKRKIKGDYVYCFACGKVMSDHEYQLDLGSPGATFELCRSCARNLANKIAKALEPERRG